jgi:hypothetical protein
LNVFNLYQDAPLTGKTDFLFLLRRHTSQYMSIYHHAVVIHLVFKSQCLCCQLTVAPRVTGLNWNFYGCFPARIEFELILLCGSKHISLQTPKEFGCFGDWRVAPTMLPGTKLGRSIGVLPKHYQRVRETSKSRIQQIRRGEWGTKRHERHPSGQDIIHAKLPPDSNEGPCSRILTLLTRFPIT